MKKDKIKIVYEDKSIIVVDKPAHLLTISTNNEKEKTMFHKVLLYERSKNKNNKIFIVHRLDKDTSGLIIFAKSERVKNILQNNWDAVKRGYAAVVEGKVNKESDVIKSYLVEDKNFIIHSTNKDNGKLAITKYKKINQSKSYSLLNIEILTGRKNQIRVHMSEMGHPIIGDKKYKAKTNPLKRLGLIANYLQFKHPTTEQTIELNLNIPKEFLNMFPESKQV